MRVNLLKSSLIGLSLAATVVSCGSDDNTDIIETNPDVIPSATINITEGGSASDVLFAEAQGEAGGTVNGRVIFTTTEGTQRRLYVTQTLPGGTPEPFMVLTDTRTQQRRLTKPDGSIDLDNGNKDEFDFSFTLQVPSTMAEGEVVYNFWSTTGRGDFRDTSKRLLIGVGTIVVRIGDPVATEIVSASDIELRAPLADGSSETFISFFDLDRKYRIDEGAESSTFWDFGYFFGASGNASFASANDYPSSIVNIVSLANAGIAADEPMVMASDLKRVYFVRNNSLDFDSVTTLSELNTIVDTSFTVSSASPQTINQLAQNDVIEFLDTTGSGIRGMIKVEAIVPGNGSAGVITISIKAQPNAPIMTSN